MPGELEINDRRATIVEHKQVRFLGKVVVAHAGTVQASQQPRSLFEPGRIKDPGILQWLAGKVAASQ